MSASGVRGMACILDENGRLSDLSAADLPPNEIQLPACGSAGVLQTFLNTLGRSAGARLQVILLL